VPDPNDLQKAVGSVAVPSSMTCWSRCKKEWRRFTLSPAPMPRIMYSAAFPAKMTTRV